MSPHIHPLSGFLPSFRLFGATIPVYFLVTALAFIAAMLLLVRRADSHGLSRNRALDISLVLMISGFVGSRVFHILVEEPAYYWAHPWRVFDFWSGGFVWYGGAITGAVCSVAYVLRKKEPLMRWLDLFAPVGALGYAIGRVACVLTGCCYGRVFETTGFFKFISNEPELYRYPTQSFAVITELCSLAILLGLEKRRANRSLPAPVMRLVNADGQLFFIWLVLHACGRILMEAFRDDPRGPELMGLSVSTCLSLALLLVSAGMLMKNRTRSSHTVMH